MEDQRYYVLCRRRKNQARIPVTRCFDCEFATATTGTNQVEIGCGFPLRQKRPQIKRISRD